MILDWRRSELLTRLSGPRLFDQRFFWWTYFSAFVIQITFDVIAYDSPSWLWLPIWTVGHLLATLAAIIIRWSFLDAYLTKKPNPFLNIAVAGLLGAIRVTFIGFASFELGLQDLFDLSARISAGVIAGTVGFIVIVSFTESSKAFRELSSALKRTQNQLKNLRVQTIESVKRTQLDAQREIQDVIEPKLRRISELLGARANESKTRDLVSSEIRALLAGEVRQLSASYKRPTKLLQDSSKFQGVSKANLFTLPKRVSPHLAIRPAMVMLPTLAGLPFALYVFEDASWVPIGLLIVLMDYLTFLFGKTFLATFRPMKVSTAIYSLIIVASIPVALNYPMLLIADFPESGIPYVVLLSAITIYLSMIGFGLTVVHGFNRESYLAKLEKNNARIERELALVNQQIWVEKRTWALRIHGTVQASLTAALARLSKSGKLTPEDSKMIRAHILQARKGLVQGMDEFSLAASIRNIKKTWSGLIEIKVNLSSPGAKHLVADRWAGVCANEIIKESVSNSMKHGKATKVQIRFENREPGFVYIIADDNGRGMPAQFRPGLGSQLLDEIAYPWSLTKIQGGTRLEARIPVATKSKTS